MGRSIHAVITLAVLIVSLSGAPGALAWYRTDPGQVPLRPDLPNAVDLMESGLYWLQDMTGPGGDLRDPATIINLMEDQAARYFDFAYIAYRVGGPDYTRLDALERSHFQNRIRDWLFAALARQFGMYDVRMPLFRPLLPVATSNSTWRGGGVFHHRGGPTLRIYFEFYLTPRGWRVFDVTTNGVSAVAEMRRRLFKERFGTRRTASVAADSERLNR